MLPARITSEEVRHIAALARVAMTDDEVERMRDEMAHIMENFDALSQVDTDHVEPSGHSVGLESVMRPDQVVESADREDLLANAPSRDGDFVRVRAVLE